MSSVQISELEAEDAMRGFAQTLNASRISKPIRPNYNPIHTSTRKVILQGPQVGAYLTNRRAYLSKLLGQEVRELNIPKATPRLLAMRAANAGK